MVLTITSTRVGMGEPQVEVTRRLIGQAVTRHLIGQSSITLTQPLLLTVESS